MNSINFILQFTGPTHYLVTGTPRPTMRWTKNGSELFDGGSLDLHQSAEVCVLHITNVRRADAAEYELQLSNDSGTETVPITVKVIGKCYCFLKVHRTI